MFKLIPILILGSILNTAISGEYDNFVTAANKDDSLTEESKKWINEGKELIARIDAIIARYNGKKIFALAEATALKLNVEENLNKEKGLRKIASDTCDFKSIKCDVVKIHNENIADMELKISSLNGLIDAVRVK